MGRMIAISTTCVKFTERGVAYCYENIETIPNTTVRLAAGFFIMNCRRTYGVDCFTNARKLQHALVYWDGGCFLILSIHLNLIEKFISKHFSDNI